MMQQRYQGHRQDDANDIDQVDPYGNEDPMTTDTHKDCHKAACKNPAKFSECSARVKVRDDHSPNAASIRARAAISRLEAALQKGHGQIIASQFWDQIDILEEIVATIEADLSNPNYYPKEMF